jgi:tRNA modification GTPase
MFGLEAHLEKAAPGNASRPHDGSTVAALMTAAGRSAIATVRVYGPRALAAAAALCKITVPELARKTAGGRLWIGRWNGAEGEPIVLHVCSPNSVEIHCHGGLVPSQTILDDLALAGISTVAWQTVAERSCQSSIEAEALDALARAPTLRTAAILLDQAQGALTSVVHELLRRLAQGESDAVAGCLGRMLQYSDVGRHLTAPWKVAIVGRPNVGKSSLLNALAGYDRAIVHPTAGTTRDLVTATTAIDGWPVEFTDCAGIRVASDELEIAGIARARQAIGNSDRQIVVLDLSATFTRDDEIILQSCPQPIAVGNKADRPAALDIGRFASRVLVISAHTGQGMTDLLDHLSRSLVPNPPAAGQAIPFFDRQIELLRRAERACSERRVDAARDYLRSVI